MSYDGREGGRERIVLVMSLFGWIDSWVERRRN